MYLKSITLKGFKSFPDRTRLEFGPGISVIVGPNGSGKSNITDAVLWALGEQSPLAVRGQTMQDMVFAGGQGVKGRSAAEVEVVIDNSQGRLETEFTELAISRQVDRSGEGTYRLNGARCRLVDVLEVLSDSGLGKEMHSVISQGRVEGIIHSKPADRTTLIEEAAGLTKHRKRRHRAQLKLRRTQDNLDRALDVEREARSRLRPLKRQAEAAELHARLERQGLELRARLIADDLRGVRQELATAERSAEEARSQRDALQEELMGVARSREQAERSFAEHGRAREELSGRLFAARSAAERIAIRLESVNQSRAGIGARLERSTRALAGVEADAPGIEPGSKLAELEAELGRLDRERAARLDSELAEVEAERSGAERDAAELQQRIESLGSQLEEAAEAARAGAQEMSAARARVQEATRRCAALQLELEAIGERLRLVGERARAEGPRLADGLQVDPGFEAALAAGLGGRLGARVVATVAEGAAAVGEGKDFARALVRGRDAESRTERSKDPPAPGARRLLDHVRPQSDVEAVVRRLLADAWIVERIADVPEHFKGLAITLEGVAYDGAAREVWRSAADGGERAIAERNRRDDLHGELERLDTARAQAEGETERATLALREAEERRELLEGELRELRRSHAEALEAARRGAWLIEQRRLHGVGPEDTRRAELAGEIAAERRLADRLARERAEREQRRQRLAELIARDRAIAPESERLAGSIERAAAVVQALRDRLEQELSADETVGEEVAAELRRLATHEYELQARLREAGETLTHVEVRAAQVRDRESATAAELGEVSARLAIEQEVPEDALEEAERSEVEARLERLERRRERLGPVNPLAEREYEEAIDHVEELETQRTDLEAALAELEGLIRETDRRIHESFEKTFAAAAQNFEEVIQQLFPGGSGRLRRVNVPRGPRPVLGGEEEAVPLEEVAAEAAVEDSGAGDIDTPGVEIEVTPAGKTTRRLSLLSGGEKSLVALAFMFAVFLARPCPFYILDEVEAALDDANIDRFLSLVRAYSDRAQFIVVTHQRRTMEAADVLYGVSMGKDGVSQVVSRRLEEPPRREPVEALTEAA